jgi:hypothetical protein
MQMKPARTTPGADSTGTDRQLWDAQRHVEAHLSVPLVAAHKALCYD